MSTEKVYFRPCPRCGSLAYQVGPIIYQIAPALGSFSRFRCHACDNEFSFRVLSEDLREVDGYDQDTEDDIARP